MLARRFAAPIALALLAACSSDSGETPSDADSGDASVSDASGDASGDAAGDAFDDDSGSDDVTLGDDVSDGGEADAEAPDAEEDAAGGPADFSVDVSRSGFPVDLELGDSLGTVPALTERTITYTLAHDADEAVQVRYDVAFMENCDIGISDAPVGPHDPGTEFSLRLIVFTNDVVGRFSAEVFVMDEDERIAATWTLSGSVPQRADADAGE